jgi:hypothetical protein
MLRQRLCFHGIHHGGAVVRRKGSALVRMGG